ncbi:MAG: heparinase II/III family protein [Bacteroidota bacterium]
MKALLLLLLCSPLCLLGQPDSLDQTFFENHLRPNSPRLLLTPESETLLRNRLEQDSLSRAGLALLQQRAESILILPPLTYQQTGRRLLSVSREAFRRMTTLSLLYRLERDERHLIKLQTEIEAVCRFRHWNPSHFLDVAEMAAAVALALDWAGEWLPPATQQLAREALLQKALRQSEAESYSWVTTTNNWNLVCHGGLSLAALTIFEEAPELATRILQRAVKHMPSALMAYAPDGIYPEGPSYWFYATHYLVNTLAAFESSLGTEFDLSREPGVQESALFSQITAGPTGEYYNFFDASSRGFHSLAHLGLLAWFQRASPTGPSRSLYQQRLGHAQAKQGKTNRFQAINWLMVNLYPLAKAETTTELPMAWTGGGHSPLGILRGGNDSMSLYLAAKGGRAADNHGNMDAGSFILEWQGIRWSVDPGNQSYHDLEQLMGRALWNNGQDSRRWELLTKNHLGHSTLRVNDAPFLVEGRAELIASDLAGTQPAFRFDLSPIYGENLQSAVREFRQVHKRALRITDALEFSPQTQRWTWQWVTQAEPNFDGNEILLQQAGKHLRLHVLGDVSFSWAVVSLSPPPLPYDKDLPNLKRIELTFERAAFPGNQAEIVIEVVGE